MSGDVVLRRARTEDAAALRTILQDTLESTWLPHLSAAAAAEVRSGARPAAYVASRGGLFHVAQADGEVVGLVDWDGDFVNALHVRGSHAGLGIGGRLMDVAEAEIGAAGFFAARLETDTFNARSQAFYAKRGYQELDRYPDGEWNSGLTTLLLAKRLR